MEFENSNHKKKSTFQFVFAFTCSATSHLHPLKTPNTPFERIILLTAIGGIFVYLILSIILIYTQIYGMCRTSIGHH